MATPSDGITTAHDGASGETFTTIPGLVILGILVALAPATVGLAHASYMAFLLMFMGGAIAWALVALATPFVLGGLIIGVFAVYILFTKGTRAVREEIQPWESEGIKLFDVLHLLLDGALASAILVAPSLVVHLLGLQPVVTHLSTLIGKL